MPVNTAACARGTRSEGQIDLLLSAADADRGTRSEGQIDLLHSPANAGGGGPWPDLPLTALMKPGGGSVRELAVAGGTPNDVESGPRAGADHVAGARAGAGLVAGALTGSRQEVAAVPAITGLPGEPLVLDSIAGLLPHLGI